MSRPGPSVGIARVENWRDGTFLSFLSGRITLRLDADWDPAKLARRSCGCFLPPVETTQIKNRTEAWLPAEVQRVVESCPAKQPGR